MMMMMMMMMESLYRRIEEANGGVMISHNETKAQVPPRFLQRYSSMAYFITEASFHSVVIMYDCSPIIIIINI